jgi:hypothetical protein
MIQPQTTVETIHNRAFSHWKNEEIFEIDIATRTKTETAKQLKEQHQSTLQDKKHLCLYTDEYLGEGRAGTGVFAARAGHAVHESQHYLGKQMEVFDAKLYGMAKATEVAIKLVKEEKATDVWIFYDN